MVQRKVGHPLLTTILQPTTTIFCTSSQARVLLYQSFGKLPFQTTAPRGKMPWLLWNSGSSNPKSTSSKLCHLLTQFRTLCNLDYKLHKDLPQMQQSCWFRCYAQHGNSNGRVEGILCRAKTMGHLPTRVSSMWLGVEIIANCWFVYQPNWCLELQSPASTWELPLRGSVLGTCQKRQGFEARNLCLAHKWRWFTPISNWEYCFLLIYSTAHV